MSPRSKELSSYRPTEDYKNQGYLPQTLALKYAQYQNGYSHGMIQEEKKNLSSDLPNDSNLSLLGRQQRDPSMMAKFRQEIMIKSSLTQQTNHPSKQAGNFYLHKRSNYNNSSSTKGDAAYQIVSRRSHSITEQSNSNQNSSRVTQNTFNHKNNDHSTIKLRENLTPLVVRDRVIKMS